MTPLYGAGETTQPLKSIDFPYNVVFNNLLSTNKTAFKYITLEAIT